MLDITLILGAMRRANHMKFYKVSSSQLFGSAPPAQSEDTPPKPINLMRVRGIKEVPNRHIITGCPIGIERYGLGINENILKCWVA
jgi:hypothetical protein